MLSLGIVSFYTSIIGFCLCFQNVQKSLNECLIWEMLVFMNYSPYCCFNK